MRQVKVYVIKCVKCKEKFVRQWTPKRDFFGKKVQQYVLCESCENIENVLLKMEFQ